MIRIALFSAVLCLVGSCEATAPDNDEMIVEAPAGDIRGTTVGGTARFLGIPYAQAPVGDLRWRPTVPLPRWEGVYEAGASGAACVQPSAPEHSIYYTPYPDQSEDCLFLDITAPSDARNAPVMVWIHGGSLLGGTGSDPMYDGAEYADRGIILVSINYRLGALGYMAHSELSAESPENISGNYGLMDQIQALEWVQENISSFGGNPNNVTIAGESAGALSVLYLMASPEAKGLFHRAISQSAYMVTMPDLRNSSFPDIPASEPTGVWLASQLGAGDIAELRAMSAEDITLRATKAGFYPQISIDGKYVTGQLVEVFDNGEQAQIPVLAGYNEGEIRSLPILLPPAPNNATSYEVEIRQRYIEFADRFLDLYPASDIPESMKATTRDAIYGWTAERLVASQTSSGFPSFLYFFDHGYPAADEAGLHAFHGAEMPFAFGTMSSVPPNWPEIPDTPAEQALSDAMLDYWASFVRDGVPQSDEAPDWQQYDQHRAYMAIEDSPVGRENLQNGYSLHEAVTCRRRATPGLAWRPRQHSNQHI
ncbi:carboxylesterase/lipase family protein [Parvularcula marina]|uniref:carboxylesterase/lipase family protein n=1 Tax=Parvularcula marina TaxID=2292771 RepID=UPI003515849A